MGHTRPGGASYWGAEDGAIRGNSLAQMAVILGLFGLVVYEAVAIGVTAFQLDDRARQVAIAAADAYESSERTDHAEEAAETQAEDLGVELLELEIEEETVVVEVADEAATLVTHRIGPLEDLTRVTLTGRARWN